MFKVIGTFLLGIAGSIIANYIFEWLNSKRK